MRTKLAVLLIIAMTTSSAFAIGDIAVGPFFGMTIPLANDDAKSGTMYGFQTRVPLISVFAVGGHYQFRGYGNPTQTFFEGTPNEVTMEKDGGDVTSLGLDVYLGKTSSAPGVKFYLMGSLATYSWKRDNFDDVSKTALAVGPGLEIGLPKKIGIEGRATIEVVSTGANGSWKSLLWFVGLNYHIGLGPK